MSDHPRLRYDALTDDWIVFSPARALRPHAAHSTPSVRRVTPIEDCPFCPGNEHLSPDEVTRAGSGASWDVRVVRNKYPAFEPSAPREEPALGSMFREMGGYGVHEVVVTSPDHHRPLVYDSIEHITCVLEVLQRRIASLATDPRLRAVVIFENHGERAGTSISHPHWQLVGTPIVPRLLSCKRAAAANYFARHARSVYQESIEQELASATRVLATNTDYVAVLPFASRVAYMVRILPRVQQSSFARAGSMRPLAEILRFVLGCIERALADPDYNLAISTSAAHEEDPSFRWHIEILPRLTTLAGLELGSGMSINPVLPEAAATALRS
jgi:UDPglucose--hexose-1-phosphate uridylyltransferase